MMVIAIYLAVGLLAAHIKGQRYSHIPQPNSSMVEQAPYKGSTRVRFPIGL